MGVARKLPVAPCAQPRAVLGWGISLRLKPASGAANPLQKLRLRLYAPLLLLGVASCFNSDEVDFSSLGAGSGSLLLEEVSFGRLVVVQDVDGIEYAGELGASDPLQPGNPLEVLIRADLEPDGAFYELSTNPVTEVETLTILVQQSNPTFLTLLNAAVANLDAITTQGPSSSPPFTRVPRNATVRFRLSEQVDPSSVSNNSVLFKGGSPSAALSGRYLVRNDATGGKGYVLFDPTISSRDAANLGIQQNAKGFPSSFDSTWDNISIFMPTQVDPSFGQPEVLTNLLGNKNIQPSNDDPIENSGGGHPMVTRAFRSGNEFDPHKGFLKDIVRPGLVGKQDITLHSAVADGNDWEIEYSFGEVADNPFCALLEPKKGDVIEVGVDAVLVVNEVRAVGLGTGPAGGGTPHKVLAAVVENEGVVFGAFSTSDPSLGARLSTLYQSGDSQLQACYITFLPDPGAMPAVAVDPFSSMQIHFNEPMDASTVLSMHSFVLTPHENVAAPDPTSAYDGSESVATYIDRLRSYDVVRNGANTTGEFGGRVYFGPISVSNGSKTFTLTPLAGFAEPDATRVGDLLFSVALRDGPDGIRDLAGNAVNFASFVAGSPGNSLDPGSNPTNADTRITVSGGGGANAQIKDKYFSLRGMGADEDGDGYEEYKGQFTVHPGKISGRAPQRFSRLADPSNEFVGAQGSPAAFPTDPLNPAGAVVMTVIRPSDFGFGYLDPQELNMDIEGMAWSPFGGVVYDEEYDDVSLSFGHANSIPDEAVTPTGQPAYPNSGLWTSSADPLEQINGFDWNILGFPEYDEVEVFRSQYILRQINVYQSSISGNSYLDWPGFSQTYTWRDTTIEQSNLGGRQESLGSPPSYYMGSVGMTGPIWDPEEVPSVGLGLLCRFRCFPQGNDLGTNRFAVTQMLGTSSLPAFRIFSSGGADGSGVWHQVVPDSSGYGGTAPQGGYNSDGSRTNAFDSFIYWTQADFVVRISRVTTHWFPFQSPLGLNWITGAMFEPGNPDQLPGTSIQIEYRGSQAVSHPTAPEDSSPLMAADLPFDVYGDFIAGSPGTVGLPGEWTVDPSALEGLGYGFFQLRITFVGNADDGVASYLDGYGLAYATEDS